MISLPVQIESRHRREKQTTTSTSHFTITGKKPAEGTKIERLVFSIQYAVADLHRATRARANKQHRRNKLNFKVDTNDEREIHRRGVHPRLALT